jgi:hypothetical protein
MGRPASGRYCFGPLAGRRVPLPAAGINAKKDKRKEPSRQKFF